MRQVILFLRNLLSLNPVSVAHYSDSWVLALFGVAAVCIVASFFIRRWQKNQQSITRKLSQSWSMVSFWFGVIAILFIVSRVERIQLLAMPLLWFVWLFALLAYIFIQWRIFRARHYQVVPQAKSAATDPYLAAGGRRR